MEITDNVGEGATNKAHDVALVQAMLKVVKNAKGVAYLAGNYDGVYGNQTKTAIQTFQTDYALAKAAKGPAKAAKAPGGAALAGKKAGPAIAAGKADKFGVVAKNSASFKKLAAMLPATHSKMRIIAGTKTVYIEDALANAKTSRTTINTAKDLDTGFQANVVKLIDEMYSQHKITLWVTPTGRRRTFADQATQTKTNAGPGESNHNYGRAVDIGFKDFTWVRGDGRLKKDAAWLNALEAAKSAQSTLFWDTRDKIALHAPINLHRLQFERVHLQSYDQKTASSTRSLVALLNLVGAQHWERGPTIKVGKSSFRAYKSNLGAGKTAPHQVGTARQIWAGNATVTKTMIAQAKTVLEAATTKKVYKDADITAKDLIKAKADLKADFETADVNWKKWAPVK